MHFIARSRTGGALAIFTAIAISVTILVAGSPAPAAAQGSGGNLCNITGFPTGKAPKKARVAARALSSAAGGAVARGSSIGGTLTKFVLEKAVGINIERWALTGMGNLLRMLKLDSIAPDSPEQKIFNQLHAINARLGEMEVRIERVGESVNNLTAERREKDLDDEIKGICSIADRQMFYYRLFGDAMEAGEELGKALKRADPSLPPGSDPEVNALREEAQNEMDFFINQYDKGAATSEEQIGRLRTALVPKGAGGTTPSTSTVLKTYGGVMLAGNRFLRREHSEALRALYADVLEIRSLASWMAAEFYRTQDLVKKEARVWDGLLEDTDNAEAGLPPMIPAGAVIDLGDGTRSSTNEQPMWFAPTDKDLGWMPETVIGPNVFDILDVTFAVRHLNDRAHTTLDGWHAPDKQEFLALISNSCRANPRKPSQPLVACRNAVPGGADIAAYLRKINKPNKNWQQLFCQSAGNPSCPADAGPKDGRHAFIWTSDIHSQRLLCRLGGGETAIRVNTYAGYHSLGPIKHEVFPHFPMRVGADCVEYLKGLMGDPKTGAGRNAHFKGVLLATRFTNAADTNRTGRIDYMAQPVVTAN
ncbi:MAG TPA: hypothetical protein VFI03_12580 [Solirubrobacterales bacterium]|nr:hypothetical protein [Solirubrobacterales bacterium]